MENKLIWALKGFPDKGEEADFAHFHDEDTAVLARIADQQKKLEIEREKSERLLLNILPAPIAERLKNGE